MLCYPTVGGVLTYHRTHNKFPQANPNLDLFNDLSYRKQTNRSCLVVPLLKISRTGILNSLSQLCNAKPFSTRPSRFNTSILRVEDSTARFSRSACRRTAPTDRSDVRSGFFFRARGGFSLRYLVTWWFKWFRIRMCFVATWHDRGRNKICLTPSKRLFHRTSHQVGVVKTEEYHCYLPIVWFPCFCYYVGVRR